VREKLKTKENERRKEKRLNDEMKKGQNIFAYIYVYIDIKKKNHIIAN